ncbi:MAG: biotin/lipoyl-binding protein [Myxococcales bacterium]|nr:HlyD family secretion protein [Myxococcota bacterium]MDW8282043.1 biotin/lipoyl-binding protein [Myxococcales bacterium]
MEIIHLADAELLALRSVKTASVVRRAARVMMVLFWVTLLFLLLAPWQQSSTGEGRVIAYTPVERQQTIEAPVDGRIVRWHVREGTHVKAGDLIVEMSDIDPAILERLRRERDAVAARLEAARARARAQQGRVAALTASREAAIGAADARMRMAQDRVRAAEQALTAAEAAHHTAQLNIERQQSLHARGLTSTRNVELAELERVRTSTEVDRARATLDAARNEERALRTEKERISRDASAALSDAEAAQAAALAEAAAAEAELARIEVRVSRQTAQQVRAPREGNILRLLANPGAEVVKAGDPLAILVPATQDRAVELWVDGNDVPLLSEGRHVRLQFEGWPAIQFTGWPSVAVGSFGGYVKVIDATDNGRGKFRVLVLPDEGDPWPSPTYLRQGVRVTGWILLNRVRLGYELWRQFNAFPPIVAPAEPTQQGADKADKADK